MAKQVLQAALLGSFSLRMGEQTLNDGDNRSRRIWLLLAYFIYHRSRTIPQEELLNLLWGEGERSSNPGNALKTMFHRLRAMLDQLGRGAGHTLLLREEGGYRWNPAFPVQVDVEQFDALCRAAAAEQQAGRRLEMELEALALYRGDFLDKLSSEPWVVPICAYYHNLYLTTLLDALDGLSGQGRSADVARLCRQAVGVEAYNETIYQHLMRALLELGEQGAAVQVYEDMSQLLYDSFGILPSDDTRALYRQALRTGNERALSIDILREQLQEPDSAPGALFCDYDFFKVLYHAEARAVIRGGYAVHLALLSVAGLRDKSLPKRSLDRCMENLQPLVCGCLRKGDAVTRCSASQYILMLPRANYENSCMVCERILRAFTRQYPHSPAQLHFVVQPLQPNP